MSKIVVAVCAAVLLITLQSEKCYSLEYNLESSDNVIDNLKLEPEPVFEIEDNLYIEDKAKTLNSPLFKTLSRSNYNKQDGNNGGDFLRRAVRQAYQGHTQLYPNLPSGSPYGQQPNSQSHNPQLQQPYNNNYYPQGYAPQTNGYQPNYNNPYGTYPQFPGSNNSTQQGFATSNGYNITNLPHNTPSGPYGQNPQPNAWQPYYPSNNQRPHNPSNGNFSSFNSGFKPFNSYNNSTSRPPYHQPGIFNNSSNPGYSSYSPGYRPVTTPTPAYPYNPSHKPQHYPVQNPLNNTRYPQVVPGNQHPTIYDEPTNRPGQNSNVIYNAPNWNNLNNTQGRPSQTPGYKPVTTLSPAYPYNPNQNAQQYPYQGPVNNTRYPQVVPGNQRPVIYDESTKRPGQNHYDINNVSNWNSSNRTQDTRPYASPNGQYNPQYPGSPGYGYQNTTNPNKFPNQGPPYQNSNFGQNPTNPINNYPGYSPGSATFNLANAYNPSIPNQPTYGNASPYGIPPYGNGAFPNQFQNYNGTPDPTKVSPYHFNSY